MLNIKLDKEKLTVTLEPEGKLSKEDFQTAAEKVDAFLDKNKNINGLLIHVQNFPEWDSFGALISHLKFVRDHHRKVGKVAFATDSVLGSLGEHIASHFINAEIKAFKFDEVEQAVKWLTNQ